MYNMPSSVAPTSSEVNWPMTSVTELTDSEWDIYKMANPRHHRGCCPACKRHLGNNFSLPLFYDCETFKCFQWPHSFWRSTERAELIWRHQSSRPTVKWRQNRSARQNECVHVKCLCSLSNLYYSDDFYNLPQFIQRPVVSSSVFQILHLNGYDSSCNGGLLLVIVVNRRTQIRR